MGSSEIKPVSSVRNLGAWFDKSMTMSTHIGKACSKAFYGYTKYNRSEGFFQRTLLIFSLGAIMYKLSYSLKIQVVNSLAFIVLQEGLVCIMYSHFGINRLV